MVPKRRKNSDELPAKKTRTTARAEDSPEHGSDGGGPSTSAPQAPQPAKAAARAEDSEDDDAVEDGPGTSAPQAPQAPSAANSRRDAMADLARRRAAHFAHFQADDDGQDANVHTGGDEANKLGPWSSARQLVEARADAALARKERLEGARTTVADDAVLWTASRPDWRTTPRPPPRKFLTLAERCIITVADVVDCVESLYGLPQTSKIKPVVQSQLAEAVSNRRRLTPEAFALFTEHNPSEVIINNCTQINEEVMSRGLATCCTFNLESLDLRFCGRGFGDIAAAQVAKSGPLPKLRCLRLAGAYRLTPESLLKVLVATPEVTQLLLPHCVRLQGPELQQLPRLLPQLVELDLTACGGLDGAALAAGLSGLSNLQRLTLSEVAGVDDSLLAAAAAGGTLRLLAIQRCNACTDEGVAAAAAVSPKLLSLFLDELPITQAALEHVVLHCPDLEALSVQGCRRIKSEAAFVALASAGRLRSLSVAEVAPVTGAVLRALAASCARTLVDLDISFCRNVPAAALGLLLDAALNLESVKVYGCTQMTSECVHGHRNAKAVIYGEPTFTVDEGALLASVGAGRDKVADEDVSGDEAAAAPTLGSDSDSVEFI